MAFSFRIYTTVARRLLEAIPKAWNPGWSSAGSAVSATTRIVCPVVAHRQFSSVSMMASVAPASLVLKSTALQGPLFRRCLLEGVLFKQPQRNNIKFSFRKGKRKTVKAVVKRFLRLHWGAWIHAKSGRHKKLWKKSWVKRRRLRQHVFCTNQQNKLFDHMVTRFWKRPMYFVDDPYEPYHVRNNYPYKIFTKR